MSENAVMETPSTAVQPITPETPAAKEVAVPKPVKPKNCLKCDISTVNLAAAVAACKPFVNHRTTLPILSNVSLTIPRAGLRQNRLQFHATDLDCSIQTSVEAVLRHVGSTTIPVKQLADIVKGCTGVVQLVADAKDKFTVNCGGSQTEVLGLPSDEYPAIPEDSPKFHAQRTLKIPQATLKRLFRRVECAQSSDTTRYVLNGILLQRKDDILRTVATDGRRLAMLEVPIAKGGDFSVIIPTATVAKVSRLLGDTDDVTFDVQYDEKAYQKELAASKERGDAESTWMPLHHEKFATAIRLTFDGVVGKGKKAVTLPVVVQSKIIEGTFPNYRQVIPNECLLRVELPRQELLDKVHQVVTNVRDDSQPSVRLAFTKNLLTLTTHSREGAQSKSTIVLKGDPGKERAIAFNGGYFADALLSVPDSATVLLEMVDELSPGTFKCKADAGWLYVLMPMRLA